MPTQMKLGELLTKARVISDTQLRSALSEQERWGGRLGEILVRMGALTEETLVRALGKQMNVPYLHLDSVSSVAPSVKARIPAKIAKDLSAIPVEIKDGGRTLIVGMVEPQNLRLVDMLRSVSQCRISAHIVGRQSLNRAYSRFYEGVQETLASEPSGMKFLDNQNATSGVPIPSPSSSSRDKPTVPVPELPPTRKVATSASALLTQFEEVQRKDVAALRGLVETLIERRIFTREEYNAKVKPQ